MAVITRIEVVNYLSEGWQPSMGAASVAGQHDSARRSIDGHPGTQRMRQDLGDQRHLVLAQP
jgi:hypothetical protein